MIHFDSKTLKKELKIDALAVGIPSGAADIFVKRTVDAVTKALVHKSIITTKDLTRLVVKELKKYNADLAYVYENRDKII